MPGAVIVADQNTGAGAGVAGVARNDLWIGHLIELYSGVSGNTTFSWLLVDKPPGSGAALANSDQSTTSFTPDMVGTYRVRLITNGGGPGNIQILVFRVRYDIAGALANRGWAYPAIGEVDGESNYAGNLRAWAETFEYILEDIRLNAFAAATLAAGSVEDVHITGPITASKLDGAFGAVNLVTTGSCGVGALTASGAIRFSALSTGIVKSGATGILSAALLTNADVAAAAGIDGSKISPAFAALCSAPSFRPGSGATEARGSTTSGGQYTSVDATTNTVFSWTPPVRTTGRAAITVTARRRGSDERFSTDLICSYLVTAAGVITFDINKQVEAFRSAGATGVDLVVDTLGVLIRARVTGRAGETWDWDLALTYQNTQAVS